MRNAMNIRALIVGVAMAPLVAGVALAIQTSHPTAKHHEHHGQKWHERLRDDQDRDHDCHRVEPPAPAPTPSSTPSPTPSPTPTPVKAADPVPPVVSPPAPTPTPPVRPSAAAPTPVPKQARFIVCEGREMPTRVPPLAALECKLWGPR